MAPKAVPCPARVRSRSRSPSPYSFQLTPKHINALELAVARQIEAEAPNIIVDIGCDTRRPCSDLCTQINSEKHIITCRDRPQPGKNLFAVIATIVTRWGIYDMADSPVQKDRARVVGCFSRSRAKTVFPLQCEPWTLNARIAELEPQAGELQVLRGQIQRMKAVYGEPNCFLTNTAFRTPDGSFRAVQNLGVGEEVCLTNGQTARITHATKLPQTIQDIVELVTNQGSLKVSANHRIVTIRGPRKAQRDDSVLVGDRMRALANVRSFQEGAELFDIRFHPDSPIEAFVIPYYGTQVLCAAPPLIEIFQNIPADELMRSMPEKYND